jgi:hypothetical protein
MFSVAAVARTAGESGWANPDCGGLQELSKRELLALAT